MLHARSMTNWDAVDFLTVSLFDYGDGWRQPAVVLHWAEVCERRGNYEGALDLYRWVAERQAKPSPELQATIARVEALSGGF